MNTTRRRGNKLLALAAVSALILAACGSDESDSGPSDSSGEETPGATDAADETPDDAPDDTEAPDDAPDDTEAPDDAPEETDPPAGDGPTELSGLTVVDDKTFTIELEQADPEFNLRLAYSGFSPLPDVFFDDPSAFEEQPIGNGPFMMDGAWDHDVAIQTVPYADYAGADTPSISSLRFNLYEDSLTTGYLDLQAGVVDLVRSIPGDQLESAPGAFGDRYAESPDTGIYYYGFPQYLQDQYPLDLRRALSMAVNRELINDVILAGSNIPSAGLIPPSLAGSRETVCENWTHNPEAAQAAFADFGGLDALGDEPLIVWFNTSETHAQIAEAVTNQWREVLGIENIVFENLEFSEYLPKLDAAEITGVFRLGWGADYLSPLNFLEPLYAKASTPPAGSNSTFTDIPEFDEQIELGKAAIAESGELADAIPFYNAAEDILCENVTTLPIYFTQNKYVWNDTVDNVYQDAFSTLDYTGMTGGDVVTTAGEPEHLTPPNSNESEGIEVLSVLFKNLVENDPRTAEPELVVAESIETTDGGQTYTITIADGWTFHDGTPVTADSFVDAWNYTATGANAQSNNAFFSNIVGYGELNPE